MLGNRLGVSNRRDGQRSIEEGCNAHTLPIVCDMLD